jgi:hypothetical protein
VFQCLDINLLGAVFNLDFKILGMVFQFISGIGKADGKLVNTFNQAFDLILLTQSVNDPLLLFTGKPGFKYG